MRKIILHLCADIGSDSRPYQLDSNYEVIMIGESIGVENYNPPKNVHGIIANPPCTQFSTARSYYNNIEEGIFLVNHCIKIIKEANPFWWVLENPTNGRLKNVIGKPNAIYQPWQYGSPWTKRTALWGNFVMPNPVYKKWKDVPKNKNLYIRPGRKKPSLASFHRNIINLIPEFKWAIPFIKTDADLRSLCSQNFAKLFKEKNP